MSAAANKMSSNRPYLIWKVTFSKPKLGEMDTELFKEWFQAFAQNDGLTLHVENLYGENNHHIVESCFKALARTLRRGWNKATAKEPACRQHSLSENSWNAAPAHSCTTCISTWLRPGWRCSSSLSAE